MFIALLLIPLGACAQMPEVTSLADTPTTVSVPDPTTRKAVSVTETKTSEEALASEEKPEEVTVVTSETTIDEKEGATAPPVAAEEVTTSLPVPYDQQKEFVISKIRQYFPGDEMMICIAGEESTDYIHWLPDGRLRPTDIRKKDGSIASSAKGVLQTLVSLHSEDIEARGLNMADIDDYMRFNRYLLRTQGYGAWEATYNECKARGYNGLIVMASN